MRDSRTASRKIALCAMLMALAMIFSYVEVLIPINLGVPGIKLGIANLVVVVGLFFLPAGEASGGRIPAVCYSQFDSFFCTFSLQSCAELIEFLRCCCFRKMPVLHHTFYIQIFNRNKGWLGFHNPCNCFLNIIGADIVNPLIKPLYL